MHVFFWSLLIHQAAVCIIKLTVDLNVQQRNKSFQSWHCYQKAFETYISSVMNSIPRWCVELFFKGLTCVLESQQYPVYFLYISTNTFFFLFFFFFNLICAGMYDCLISKLLLLVWNNNIETAFFTEQAQTMCSECNCYFSRYTISFICFLTSP